MVRTTKRPPSRIRTRQRALVACVFGTRPQLIKLASVWKRLAERSTLLLIDSGQHYDRQMAGVFYAGKRIRRPDINLGIRARSAGLQVARISAALEPVFSSHRPAAVVTFGDTSTTAGAAIAAAYQNIPIAHVEAGLRSHDQTAAEEKNRVLTDHVSRWLFCPTESAIRNLKREGITTGVFGVGDVLFETFRVARAAANPRKLAKELDLTLGEYCLVTCHRAETVDRIERLSALVDVLETLGCPAVFAVHPRARKNLIRNRFWQRLKSVPGLRLVPPLDHVQTISAIAGARTVLTDSGGVQREAAWSGVPCLILRDRTEWKELVQSGAARLVDVDATRVRRALNSRWTIRSMTDSYFQRRDASQRIVDILLRDLISN